MENGSESRAESRVLVWLGSFLISGKLCVCASPSLMTERVLRIQPSDSHSCLVLPRWQHYINEPTASNILYIK